MAGTRAKVPVGFKPKDLMLIGAQVAIALQKDGWFLRNEIIWHKKGVRPENVSDRFTRTHEKVYLFSKASNYWFNQDDVREPLVTRPPAMAGSTDQALPRRVLRVGDRVRVWTANPLGRNGRDIWEIATTSHKGKHPATFPTELVRRCLKASCPPGGHVLDPFGGSGTTGLAAVELGHTATLVELNPEYVMRLVTGSALRPRRLLQSPSPDRWFSIKARHSTTVIAASSCGRYPTGPSILSLSIRPFI